MSDSWSDPGRVGRGQDLPAGAAAGKMGEGEQLLRAVFDVAEAAIVLIDEAGRYVDANLTACGLFGIERSRLIGSFVGDDPGTALLSRERWAALLEAGATTHAFAVERADGTTLAIEARTVPNVQNGLHLTVLRDVSSTQRAHAELRASDLRFRALMENASEAIWLIGADGRVRYATATTLRIIGYEAERVIGTLATDWILEEDRAHVDAETQALVQEPGKSRVMGCRIRRPTGEVRWMECTGSLLLEGPDAGLLVSNFRDVTDRKHAEADLLASEFRFRHLIENTSEGIWMADTVGRTTFVNPRMAEMLGRRVDEMRGSSLLDYLVYGEDAAGRERAASWLASPVRNRAERHEVRLGLPDGTHVWTTIHADPIVGVGGAHEGWFAIVNDVTERRRADQTRNQLAAIVESSDDAILSMTLEGVITSWNRGAQALFGYAEEECLGQRVSVVVPQERRGEEVELLRRIAGGGSVRHHETIRRCKDGRRVDVSLTVSPIYDAAGAVVGVSKIARDITERKKAEHALRRSEEQLRQSQKMEAVGSLAGGVAHDFNNLLSVILSYCSLVLDDLPENSPLRADVEQIQAAGDRATGLTRQLLAFSRKQILQPVVLDVNQVVEDVEKMLQRLLGDDVELAFVTRAEHAAILADRGQLEQVLMNLLVNARDAMPRGGSVTVATVNVQLGAEHLVEQAAAQPGAYVMLAVTDTGVGMDAETQARVFEPFFTTKDKSKGTGLGLSTVYGIVQQSRGHIEVESEPGRGTTFKVYLPQSAALPPVAASPGVPPNLRGTETILLVEDEEQVRVTTRTVLRKHGYTVLEAQNGSDALRVADAFRGQIHLLLTDVIMPKMDGPEMAERLKHARPQVKVLFVSGYTDNAIARHGVLDAGVELLTKPVSPAVLLAKVRTLLDADRSS